MGDIGNARCTITNKTVKMPDISAVPKPVELPINLPGEM